MISLLEVAEKTDLLAAIAAGSTWPKPGKTNGITPGSYAIIKNAAGILSLKDDFLKETSSDGDLVFHLPRFAAFPLIIKKEDRAKEDPPVYINKDGDIALLFPCSSVILLTEFAFALYKQGAYVYEHNDLKNYPLMRQHFTLFCKENEFPNKIWLNKKSDCFNLVFANEEKQYFVAATAEALQNLKADLKIPDTAPAKKKGQAFDSDFVQQAEIRDNVLSGQILLPKRKQPVEATFEDEDSEKPVFPLLVSQAQKIAAQLTPKEIKNLAAKAAAEITDAAYSQSDYTPATTDYKRLTDTLELTAINFFGDEAMLIFESKNEFPNKKIYTQIDDSLQVMEVTIS